MKKFVKVSLIIAGIFAAAGVVMCLLSMIFGGRNLVYLIRDDDYLEEKIDAVGDKLEDIAERTGRWHFERRSTSPERLVVNDTMVEMTGMEAQQSVEGIRELELVLGAGSFVIHEKDAADGVIDIYVQGRGGCSYRVKDDKFYVEGFKGIQTIGNDISENVITLVVPAGTWFEEVDIEVGAGVMEISGLQTAEVDASIGAGELIMRQVDTGELSVEAGAGRIEARDMISKDVSITVSMGECIYEGTASGNIDVECDMGNIKLSLKEKEKDFNYEIECGMGSIEIGGMEFSGFGSERRVDNGAYKKFDAECSMGSIVVDFQE